MDKYDGNRSYGPANFYVAEPNDLGILFFHDRGDPFTPGQQEKIFAISAMGRAARKSLRTRALLE